MHPSLNEENAIRERWSGRQSNVIEAYISHLKSQPLENGSYEHMIAMRELRILRDIMLYRNQQPAASSNLYANANTAQSSVYTSRPTQAAPTRRQPRPQAAVTANMGARRSKIDPRWFERPPGR